MPLDDADFGVFKNIQDILDAALTPTGTNECIADNMESIANSLSSMVNDPDFLSDMRFDIGRIANSLEIIAKSFNKEPTKGE